MRFVVQRVQHADVKVDGITLGEIGHGLLVLIGIAENDTEAMADKLVDKLVKLRIFDDEAGKTNLSSADVGGEFLLISQFTLYADCKKGNRPSFIRAGKPDMANAMYEYIISKVKSYGMKTERGEFGADMKVSLLNDGPFTVILDSDEIIG